MNKKLIKIRCEETGEFVNKLMSLEEVIDAFENMVFKSALEIFEDIDGLNQNINEVEDINTYGIIELIKCYKSYDYKKGSFSNILYIALKALRKRMLRDLNAGKRNVAKKPISLEGTRDELDAFQERYGIEDEVLEQSELVCDLARALKSLTEEEGKILEFLIKEHKTKREFATELGITRPTLDTRIKKTKEKLEILLAGHLI